MRIAIVNWSRRKVGGAEGYLDLIIPQLLKANHQVAFWHENDKPVSREQIALPEEIASWCVDQIGAESALGELHRWSPDVIYAHRLLDPRLESSILEIAPAVFLLIRTMARVSADPRPGVTARLDHAIAPLAHCA